MRTPPTVRYPFAATSISPGSSIDDSISWREVPAGLLPEWSESVGGISSTAIAADEPLLPSMAGNVLLPGNWWAVSLPLPTPVAPGTHIRVVLADGNIIEGVIIDGVVETGFTTTGTVAFAPDDAPLVALAASNDALVVMVAAGTTISGSTG